MQAIRRIERARTCFFLCDIQEKFRPIVTNYGQVVQTASKMIKYQINNKSIKDILDPIDSLGKTVKELDLTLAFKIVEKTKFSMYVSEVAKEMDKFDHVVLFGIEVKIINQSHVCILQTAMDLRVNNKSVYVVLDGISSINQEEVKVAVNTLRDIGCVVTTSESILFQILGDATDPEFKQISALIKETRADTKDSLSKLIPSL